MSKFSQKWARPIAISKDATEYQVVPLKMERCRKKGKLLVPTLELENLIFHSLEKRERRATRKILTSIGWNTYIGTKWACETFGYKSKEYPARIKTPRLPKPDTVILNFSSLRLLMRQANLLAKFGFEQNHIPERIIVVQNGSKVSVDDKLFLTQLFKCKAKYYSTREKAIAPLLLKFWESNVEYQKQHYAFCYNNNNGTNEYKKSFARAIRGEAYDMKNLMLVMENPRTNSVLEFVDMIVESSSTLPQSISVFM